MVRRAWNKARMHRRGTAALPSAGGDASRGRGSTIPTGAMADVQRGPQPAYWRTGRGNLGDVDPTDLLDAEPMAVAVFEKVRSSLAGLGEFDIRTSRSQVAFRRKHGFAYLWRPGQYLSKPGAEVVLTIALGHHGKE
jgi:hypothetical protein